MSLCSVQFQILAPGKTHLTICVGHLYILSPKILVRKVFWEILLGLYGKKNLQAAASVPTLGEFQCI